MFMHIYYELIFEVADKDLDVAHEKIVEIMQSNNEITIPLWTGIRVNWAEAH